MQRSSVKTQKYATIFQPTKSEYKIERSEREVERDFFFNDRSLRNNEKSAVGKNEVIKCLEQGYFIIKRESWSGFNGRESRIENCYCDLAFNFGFGLNKKNALQCAKRNWKWNKNLLRYECKSELGGTMGVF